MNENPEETGNSFENNPMTKDRFAVLYSGAIVLKQVFYPELAKIMGIRHKESGYIKVKVQPFCGIDLANNFHSFLAGVFFIHPVSGKIRSDLVFYVLGAERDLVISYRIGKILGSLSEINMAGNVRIINLIATGWTKFTRSAKKQAARDIGISIQKLEEIMEMFPPDLERVNPELEKYSIKISTGPFQEAVLAEKIVLTPLLKSLGVKSADEIAKEEQEMQSVIKSYSKYLKVYFGERFKQDCVFARMFADCAIEAINALKSGNIPQEKDVVLGIALIRMENKVLNEALQSSMDVFPQEIIEEMAWDIKGIDAKNKKDVIENVTGFLASIFPESGLSAEGYKRKILDAMDVIEMSKKV